MPEMITQNKSDSSIEISKNSRGFSYSCKAYGETPEEITKKLVELINRAKELTQLEEQ